MKKIIIGSRSSALAIAQSEWVADRINDHMPHADISILTMTTEGDRRLDRSLADIGGKGLFTAELEAALRTGEIDIAVHSLKDMPQDVPEDLPIVALSSREDPRDALVISGGELKKIGSSSPRRKAQLKLLYPDAEIVPMRGNVQTRLRKLEEGVCDALVLAAAGLSRLKLSDKAELFFEVNEMIPAAGQGILAIQGRTGERYEYLSCIDDEISRIAYAAESAFIRELGASCTSPVGAHAVVDGECVTLYGMIENERVHIGEMSCGILNARELGCELAQKLLSEVNYGEG